LVKSPDSASADVEIRKKKKAPQSSSTVKEVNSETKNSSLFIYLFYYYYHNRHLIYIQSHQEEQQERHFDESGTSSDSVGAEPGSRKRKTGSSTQENSVTSIEEVNSDTNYSHHCLFIYFIIIITIGI
jgi:hypothetical protein